MISCKLEQMGDRLVLVLDEDAVTALNARIGDTVSLDPGPDRVLRVVERETWAEDTHARGRAFLKRYQRTLGQLS
jgi:hypothetical protein